MNKILSISVIILLGILYSFTQPKVQKPQFFVVGHQYQIDGWSNRVDWAYDVNINGQPPVRFYDRNEMLKYMNSIGYRCVSFTDQYYSSYQLRHEFYMFE